MKFEINSSPIQEAPGILKLNGDRSFRKLKWTADWNDFVSTERSTAWFLNVFCCLLEHFLFFLVSCIAPVFLFPFLTPHHLFHTFLIFSFNFSLFKFSLPHLFFSMVSKLFLLYFYLLPIRFACLLLLNHNARELNVWKHFQLSHLLGKVLYFPLVIIKTRMQNFIYFLQKKINEVAVNLYAIPSSCLYSDIQWVDPTGTGKEREGLIWGIYSREVEQDFISLTFFF